MQDSPTPPTIRDQPSLDRPPQLLRVQLPVLGACGCGASCGCGCQSGGACQCGGCTS